MQLEDDPLFARVSAAFGCLDHPEQTGPLAVAVSGGGDSMALLDLARRWGHPRGIGLQAITVDHGLRDTAAAEIAGVAAYCRKYAISHHVLRWTGWNQVGNLQDAARTARRDLIAAKAKALGCTHTLYGHTADDQAETFLMRLARGSGVDGLSGITDYDLDAAIVRPLLSAYRADLRSYLETNGIPWFEDPSNDDLRFDRIKARQMMTHLSALGLTAQRIVQTTGHMTRARSSLRTAAVDFATRFLRVEAGDIIFAPAALRIGSDDTGLRVFAAALQWIGASDYRPRFNAVVDAAAAVRIGQTRTLNGVIITPEGEGARMIREYDATAPAVLSHGGETTLSWDRRWQIDPDPQSPLMRRTQRVFPPDIAVRALGDDLSSVTGWRAVGLPRASLIASPALFQNGTLIAAPVAGYSQGWQARIVADFHSFLLSH